MCLLKICGNLRKGGKQSAINKRSYFILNLRNFYRLNTKLMITIVITIMITPRVSPSDLGCDYDYAKTCNQLQSINQPNPTTNYVTGSEKTSNFEYLSKCGITF